jgi:hypothetical protein
MIKIALAALLLVASLTAATACPLGTHPVCTNPGWGPSTCHCI